ARCRASEPRNPPALGYRKQTALGARCRLRRRPQPQTRRPCGAELLHPQPYCPQPAQTGQILQTRNQGETAQSRLGSTLSAQIAWNLICVGPAAEAHNLDPLPFSTLYFDVAPVIPAAYDSTQSVPG